MIHLRKKKKEEHTPKVKKKTGIIQSILNPIGFAKKLYDDDQVMTNAATITLFMVMSLFPMLMILLWLMSRMMAVARGTSKDSILCSSRRNA